jgi:hypothetical protein
MHVPRPHWDRFIAVRIKASDLAAMSSRLLLGSVAVIDRHNNAPIVRRTHPPDMFLLNVSDGLAIRHIETIDGNLLARATNPEFPLEVIEYREGNDLLAAIVGRVCFLQVQL